MLRLAVGCSLSRGSSVTAILLLRLRIQELRAMAQAKPAVRSDETEEQLISAAVEAVSHCRWIVGECAAKWTQRYARGRTDADFAALIGITADQVFQRRRVWETFGSVRGDFRTLK